MTQLAIGDVAPDVTVPDQSGELVRLAQWWTEHPLVLIFLRHFG